MTELINKQVSYNQNKNLMALLQVNGFAFTESTRRFLCQWLQQGWHKRLEHELLEHTVPAVLSSFYKVNQFFHFNEACRTTLRKMYQQLFKELQAQDADHIDFALLERRHYFRLQQWLVQSNPAAQWLYPAATPLIDHFVVCAEYTAKTQLHVLGICDRELQGPVLDIGCGKHPYLVQQLRQQGIEAYGIDREIEPSAFTFQKSWLEFAYRPQHWGTIISHLGFSNHFLHQHLLKGGQHQQYAATYMKILQALKRGGRFYYAPDLPFIECWLDPDVFVIQKKPVASTPYQAVIITRL